MSIVKHNRIMYKIVLLLLLGIVSLSDAENNYKLSDEIERLRTLVETRTNVLISSNQNLRENLQALHKRLDVQQQTVENLENFILQRQGYPETLFNKIPANVVTSSCYWTTILRRTDGSEHFNRTWFEYKNGFGKRNGEFFIGLEHLHVLTSVGEQHELLIILKDYEGETRYAKYDNFVIGNEAEQYALNELGEYSGTAGNSLIGHLGMKFSTVDRDNDIHDTYNCAKFFGGGWWFYKCLRCHLTGPYKKRKFLNPNECGIRWTDWKMDLTMSYVEMMIRTKVEEDD